MNEQEDKRTPKEKYDAEMKAINSTISPDTPEGKAGLSKQDIKELDEEVEAVEEAMDELDKNMGDVKESPTTTMTQDEHLDQQINNQRERILKQFTGVGAKQERLTTQQQKTMTKVLELVNQKKLDDPVLVHLVNKKLDLAQEQAGLATEIKEVQLEVVKKMSDLADKSMKAKGAVEHYNRDILLYVQKNPKVLAE